MYRNFGFKPPKVVPKNKGGKKKHLVSGRGRMEGHEFDGINGKMYRQTESRNNQSFPAVHSSSCVIFGTFSKASNKQWMFPKMMGAPNHPF